MLYSLCILILRIFFNINQKAPYYFKIQTILGHQNIIKKIII